MRNFILRCPLWTKARERERKSDISRFVSMATAQRSIGKPATDGSAASKSSWIIKRWRRKFYSIVHLVRALFIVAVYAPQMVNQSDICRQKRQLIQIKLQRHCHAPHRHGHDVSKDQNATLILYLFINLAVKTAAAPSVVSHAAVWRIRNNQITIYLNNVTQYKLNHVFFYYFRFNCASLLLSHVRASPLQLMHFIIIVITRPPLC